MDPNAGSRAKSGLNKSILSAGWGQFQQICVNKAECAGSRVLFVSPTYTSQMCSDCGAIVQEALEERWHTCTCGCSLGRDHDTEVRLFKSWLRKHPQARDTAEVFKRALADTRLPQHGSRSLYEARLRLHGYSAEEIALFQGAWKDMMFMQS